MVLFRKLPIFFFQCLVVKSCFAFNGCSLSSLVVWVIRCFGRLLPDSVLLREVEHGLLGPCHFSLIDTCRIYEGACHSAWLVRWVEWLRIVLSHHWWDILGLLTNSEAWYRLLDLLEIESGYKWVRSTTGYWRNWLMLLTLILVLSFKVSCQLLSVASSQFAVMKVKSFSLLLNFRCWIVNRISVNWVRREIFLIWAKHSGLNLSWEAFMVLRANTLVLLHQSLKATVIFVTFSSQGLYSSLH